MAGFAEEDPKVEQLESVSCVIFDDFLMEQLLTSFVENIGLR